MKKGDDGSFTVRAILLAVQGALIAMCAAPLAAFAADATNAATPGAPAAEAPAAVAQAAEAPAGGAVATPAATTAPGIDTANEDVRALICSQSYVEIGALGVSQGSSKFGEYNGLYKQGGYGLGNFDMRGGDAYCMGSGTKRWELYGTDLGTTSREVGASVGSQGQWSLGVGFDQLRHYTTGGTYQTPFQGSMGGNNFTLPSTFGAISTQAAPGTRSLTANQLSSFQTQDVYSERQNTSFKGGYDFNRQWNVKFDFNRLDQSGAKLIGAGTDPFTGGPGGFNYRAENIAILMNPTQFQTDTFNFTLNSMGEKGHMSASYYGSFFHDDNNGLSFSNPFTATATPTGTVPGAPFPVDTMSTPPSNDFQQLNLTGGYNFSPATKLAGGLSYGRNTQNDSYAGTYTTTPNTVPGLPVSSLNGLVVTTHADLRLTNQATKALTLNAGLKYNERDNRTPSNTYNFLDIGGASNTVVNIPMSNRRAQLELAGAYRITPKQRLQVGYDYDYIKRWCNNDVANNAQGVGPVGSTAAAYYTTASCVQVPEDKENKLAIDYKLSVTDTVDASANYSYAKRKAYVNSSFYNPMQANNQGYENFGWIAFFDASRDENTLKARVNWQATERFNLSLSGRYVKDDYFDSTLGVQDGHTESANLDGSYSLSEYSLVSAYVTWQNRQRDLLTANGRNAVAPLPNLWTNTLKDEDYTFGLSGKQKGLMGGKLELAQSLTYSLAKSMYSTALQFASATVGAAGDTPDIKSELTQFKFTGGYQLSKPSQIVMGYWYQRLRSSDYYYNAYQYGFTPTSLLPTNQQAPHYNVNVIFLAYNYTFQ